MKKVLFLIPLIIFNSCNISSKKVKKNDITKIDNIVIGCDRFVCYKFLQNGNDSLLNEKSFWGLGHVYNEFSFRIIKTPIDKFYSSISTFNKVESLDDFSYDYAFVNNCNDTIYANGELSQWIIKKKGVSNFYKYDKNRKNVDTLFVQNFMTVDNFFRY
ncbi:hypothetical protein [Chryseobacterium sp. JAH]|uniref:hypothetical protein n=1 Tax=Chryseobacterium sp. JAH TaxID=1742858 RepID=UPI0007412255|nr:hypothetical protein [Chryseobacterium sp. JAH]KUJ49926.1 hypothetical protein AR685_17035 [Chryseobacterium sp. JAH]